jgi:ubiquinone/menaquinone biosynthesis C-methylase UbiE
LSLNDDVRRYWEREPCGTSRTIVGDLPERTRDWFERIEEHRYRVEPFIHSVAQFTRHHDKTVLEVGVGAGIDLLQWARAGATCYGVDLTDAAIETTRARLALYGFSCTLTQVDAEQLPFADESFDVVYSWGVIHHSEHPERMVQEIRRVLKPGGMFIGMVYGRRSLVAVRLWIRHALRKGAPLRSVSDVIWHHMESVGTKAYTAQEVRALFAGFRSLAVTPLITPYDVDGWPRWIARLVPESWGWFIAVHGRK